MNNTSSSDRKHQNIRLALLLAMLLFWIGASATSLQAQITRHWTPQGFSRDWHDGANWTPQGVPNGLDDVIHDDGLRPISLENGATPAVDNLVLTTGARLFTEGNKLTVNAVGNSGLVRIFGSGSELIVEPGPLADVDSVDIEVSGNLKMAGGTIRLDRTMFVDFDSRITGHGLVGFDDQDINNPPVVMTVDGTIRPSGGELRIEAETDSAVTFNNAHLDANFGDLSIDATQSEPFRGTVTIGAGHILDSDQQFPFADTATLNLLGGDTDQPAVFHSPSSVVSARVNVNGSAVMTGDTRLTTRTLVNLPDSDDHLRLQDVAVIMGDVLDANEIGATFAGDGQLVNETSTGLLLLNQPVIEVPFVNSGPMDLALVVFVFVSEVGAVEFDSFRQTETGIMRYDIGILAGEVRGDMYSVDETAELDGALEVSLVDIQDAGLPTLVAGDNFDIVTAAGGVFGRFSSTSFPTPPDGTSWRLNYNMTSVILELVDGIFITPDSMTVTRGQLASGSSADLAESDNSDVSIQRSLSDLQSRTEFVVESTSPVAIPSSMDVTLEGSVFARSEVTQTIELFDYQAGSYELVDSRIAARFNDSIAIVSAGVDPFRFVEPGTLKIKARVRYQSTNPRQRFSSNTDQFIWLIGG